MTPNLYRFGSNQSGVFFGEEIFDNDFLRVLCHFLYSAGCPPFKSYGQFNHRVFETLLFNL